MNFYEFQNPKVGKFWVAAETMEGAVVLLKSGEFTIVDLNKYLPTPKAESENSIDNTESAPLDDDEDREDDLGDASWCHDSDMGARG